MPGSRLSRIPAPGLGPPYCTRPEAGGRFLRDQYGNPFLIVADSGWGGSSNIGTGDMQLWLSTRSGQGFNSALVAVVWDSYGDPFNPSNGQTFDGIPAFTGTIGGGFADLTTPNPTFFARVDTLVGLAAVYGITLFLLPLNCANYPFASGSPSWSMQQVSANPLASCTSFGNFLGNRYKNARNVVWMHGDDYQAGQANNDDANMQAIANGIKANDLNHMHTLEPLNLVNGTNNTVQAAGNGWPNICAGGIGAAYPGGGGGALPYQNYQSAYAATPVLPFDCREGTYDEGVAANSILIRNQCYWALTCGACGTFYGCGPVAGFSTGWQSAMTTEPTIGQYSTWATFARSLKWWTLVPDTTNGAGHLVNSGFSSGATQAWGAVDAIGSLALVYVPTNGPVVVDLTKMRGTTVCRWFDPVLGTYTALGSFPNTGTQSFTSPAARGDGSQDFALVLTA